MKGTSPLDNNEIRRVSAGFTGTFARRNRGLFMISVSTGGRISELLSLQIGDVYQNHTPVSDLLFEKLLIEPVWNRNGTLDFRLFQKSDF